MMEISDNFEKTDEAKFLNSTQRNERNLDKEDMEKSSLSINNKND